MKASYLLFTTFPSSIFLFPPPQFYYFGSSFLNSFLDSFNIFPQFFVIPSTTILIFSLNHIIFPPQRYYSLLHNFIIFPPPPPPPPHLYCFLSSTSSFWLFSLLLLLLLISIVFPPPPPHLDRFPSSSSSFLLFSLLLLLLLLHLLLISIVFPRNETITFDFGLIGLIWAFWSFRGKTIEMRRR